MSDAALNRLVDRVLTARATKTALDITGGGTKAFYGEAPRGEPLPVRELAGISSHEPTELVVTVRAGTPLAELEAALLEKQQCLPFEPPRFADGGTVGGMVAAGLAGPARASAGAVRDYVLGATLLDGRGELLTFGGQVMKNVAGYDVSRVLAGSLGTLGVICEVSLKVLPIAPATRTLRLEKSQPAALRLLNEWAGLPLPLSASAWWDGLLVVRLAGAHAAVDAAAARLGGETIDEPLASTFGRGLRDHGDEFFAGAKKAAQGAAALWRIALPSVAPPLALSGEQLIEWGGAQRWFATSTPAPAVREAARRAGGHATLFYAHDKSAGVFTPLAPPNARIQRALKDAFDPDRVFNPGRMYPDL
jgi:glycolate oxidase FAD binding subunit